MVGKYRRIEDGLVLDAVQYGKPGRGDMASVSTVAAFVLGLDVVVGVTAANERMLDVVTPVRSRWNPNKGFADINVVDPGSGLTFRMELGDWVGRHGGLLLFVKHWAFDSQFEEILPEAQRTEFDDLSDVIYASFSTLEGELYQALAESAAAAVIRAGWSRKKE